MPRFEPVTIEEIAARAGVSPGTVSRVLNGKNKENRPSIAKRADRIRGIASKLGYRPNVAARSILSGRFDAVAFVTCGDMGTDWYPISGLNGIHTELDRLQWRLLFSELSAQRISNPSLVPQLFRELAVDGFIVNLLPVFSDNIIDYFEAHPVPCVWLNLKRKLRSVYPDESGGAAMAVKWLLERGDKKIGYFSRHFTEPAHFSVADRFAGFKSAMESAGLSSHRHLDLYSPHVDKHPTVMERAQRFLHQFPDTEAVLCYELEESICLSTAADRAGRLPPNDLKIVGFNEREIRSSTGLPIPTVIVPFHEVGRQTVLMLHEMIDTQQFDAASVKVPFKSILI